MCALLHQALISIHNMSVWWKTHHLHIFFMQILEYSHENLSPIGWKPRYWHTQTLHTHTVHAHTGRHTLHKHTHTVIPDTRAKHECDHLPQSCDLLSWGEMPVSPGCFTTPQSAPLPPVSPCSPFSVSPCSPPTCLSLPYSPFSVSPCPTLIVSQSLLVLFSYLCLSLPFPVSLCPLLLAMVQSCTAL